MTRAPSPWTEYADCPRCERPVAVYNPRHGDGTMRMTHWHKDPDREWCRAEVDYVLPGQGLRRTRLPSV